MIMQSGNERKYLCLDPSCFVSLENLKNVSNLLHEFNQNKFHVIIPTNVYDVIILQPDEKFANLPSILNDWLKEENHINKMTKFERDEYVNTMRNLLMTYQPSPAKGFVRDLEKIGDKSIYKNSLIEKLGRITGEILFEVMTVSSEYKAQIVALGEKTFDLMQKMGTEVKRGVSKTKKELKNRARIRTPLLIAMLFMEGHGMLEFIQSFEIEGFLFNPKIIPPAGIIILANG